MLEVFVIIQFSLEVSQIEAFGIYIELHYTGNFYYYFIEEQFQLKSLGRRIAIQNKI